MWLQICNILSDLAYILLHFSPGDPNYANRIPKELVMKYLKFPVFLCVLAVLTFPVFLQAMSEAEEPREVFHPQIRQTSGPVMVKGEMYAT